MAQGGYFYSHVDSWPEGVVRSTEPDLLPPGAVPSARNATLRSVGAGRAIWETRRGAVRWSAGVAPSRVYGQHFFRTRAGSTIHLASAGTALYAVSTASVSTAAAGVWTMTPSSVAFITANDFAFVVAPEGTAAGFAGVKVSASSTVSNFGLATSAAPGVAEATSSTAMTGDYEIAVTLYADASGHESSLSATTSISVSTASILVTQPTVSDAQVSHWRVYVRKASIQSQFWRAVSLGVATTTTLLNLSDDDLNALTLPAPSTTENNPPPVGLRALAWFKGRLFGIDASQLYYSGLGKLESWNPLSVELVNPDDGQELIGLFADHDVLLILKRDSAWVLTGEGPSDWSIQKLHSSIGCVSQASIRSVDGVTYWWSELGPVSWEGPGSPVSQIGTPLLGLDLSLAPTQLGKIFAAVDRDREILLWALPASGETEPSFLLPFHYRLRRWVSESWNPFRVTSVVEIEDSASVPWVVLTDPAGGFFQWWNGSADGLTAAEITLTGTVAWTASAAVTTMAIAGAESFLVERSLTFEHPTTHALTRTRVTASAAGVVTFTPPVTLEAGVTYRYHLGSIDFDLQTGWADGGYPFHKKRFEFCYLLMKGTTGGELVGLDLAFNFDASYGRTRQAWLEIPEETSVWDSAVWDTSLFESGAARRSRTRVARTGHCWRARIRHWTPGQTITLYKVGMDGETLTRNS